MTEHRTLGYSFVVQSPQRARDAVNALVSAADSLGLAALVEFDPGKGRDIVVTLPGGSEIGFQVKSTSLITADSAPGQLRRWSKTLAGDAARVVVADRITKEARNCLSNAGWSWLDLRGHLRLTASGLLIDSDVPALEKSGPERQGLKGQVSIELAALLLLDSTQRIGIRAAATMLSRAPSSISDAFASMRAGGLIDGDRQPIIPNLFWELVEHWRPVSRDVASVPVQGGRDDKALLLGFDDIESTVGWALTDTVAAATYGAPVSIRAGYPPDFYVPDDATLRRAVQLLGTAATSSSRAGRIRVAPIPLICARRVDARSWANEEWPLANPLFVALDLAQDPGRGREILNAWTPQKPWNRVW